MFKFIFFPLSIFFFSACIKYENKSSTQTTYVSNKDAKIESIPADSPNLQEVKGYFISSPYQIGERLLYSVKYKNFIDVGKVTFLVKEPVMIPNFEASSWFQRFEMKYEAASSWLGGDLSFNSFYLPNWSFGIARVSSKERTTQFQFHREDDSQIDISSFFYYLRNLYFRGVPIGGSVYLFHGYKHYQARIKEKGTETIINAGKKVDTEAVLIDVENRFEKNETHTLKVFFAVNDNKTPVRIEATLGGNFVVLSLQ